MWIGPVYSSLYFGGSMILSSNFFFFKHKTAYEMRISDWRSDVCASDLLDRLLDELRTRRIVIPGISVVERMSAEAMLRVETDLVAAIHDKLDADMRQRLDTLVDEKVHDRQSRLSWLREPQPRVASASLAEILEK